MILKLVRSVFFPLKYHAIEKQIQYRLKYSPLHKVESWVDRQKRIGRISEYDACCAFFSVLKDSSPDESIPYGKKALSIKYDAKLSQALDVRIKRVKDTQDQEHRRWIASHNVTGLINYAKTNSPELTEQWLLQAIELKPELELNLYKTFFNLYKDDNVNYALKYGRKAIALGVDEQFVAVFEKRNERFVRASIKGVIFSELFDKIKTLIDAGNVKTAFDYYRYIPSEKVKLKMAKAVFSEFKDRSTHNACLFIKPVLSEISEQAYIKVAAARFYTIKDMKTAAELYARHLEVDESDVVLERFAIAFSLSHQQELMSKNPSTQSIDPIVRSALPYGLSDESIDTLVYWVTYLTLKNIPEYSSIAIDAACHLARKGNKKIALALSKYFFEQGHIDQATNSCQLDSKFEPHYHQLALLAGYKKLLDNGFPMPEKLYDYQGIPNKFLYTLYNSLPVHSAGYATRAHGLMLELRNKGFDLSAITRLGYPQDLSNFRHRPVCSVEHIDGISYYRLPTETEGHGFIPLDGYLIKYAEHIIEHTQQHCIGVLHSASNFINGVATNYAAKALGIKSIYEIRGLWEVTRVSRQPEWKGSEHYEMIKRLETESAFYADHVITITQALKDEMVRRGISENKITIVPNGVDTSRFEVLPRNAELEEQLTLKDQVVIGYVGSMVDYEGLDLLIKAAEILKGRHLMRFSLLMVGDGVVKSELEQMVLEKGLDDVVMFTGRVPHDSVEDYYSLIDICPFPRKGLPVCEMVSPLKPFEAMAMGKAVVSSDVAALAEIVQDGKTGLLHKKDDAEDLADKLQLLIEKPELREQYGQAAREWVVAERDWKVIAKRVDAVYKKLLGNDVDEKVA